MKTGHDIVIKDPPEPNKMFWIEIYTNGHHGKTILDYVYEEEPVIEDLDDYFGGRFEMQMGPQKCHMKQHVVKSPPKEWLKEQIGCLQCKIQSLQQALFILQKNLEELAK